MRTVDLRVVQIFKTKYGLVAEVQDNKLGSQPFAFHPPVTREQVEAALGEALEIATSTEQFITHVRKLLPNLLTI